MKIIKTLGALTMITAPIVTTIACSGGGEGRSNYLFENLSSDSDDATLERNSEMIEYIYNNYVDGVFWDFEAIDKAGYIGFNASSPSSIDDPFVQDLLMSFDSFNNFVSDSSNFSNPHSYSAIKPSILDLNKHLNGEFENIAFDWSDLHIWMYRNADFGEHFVNYENDFNPEMWNTKWDPNKERLPLSFTALSGATIGENITSIPPRFFSDVTWGRNIPISFDDPSNIKTIGESSFEMDYPSRLINYDFTDFTSLEKVGVDAFHTRFKLLDDGSWENWETDNNRALKLPKRDMIIEEDAFRSAPINEIHYYSEHHTVVDSGGIELNDFIEIFGWNGADGVTLIDLSDPANASYLPS